MEGGCWEGLRLSSTGWLLTGKKLLLKQRVSHVLTCCSSSWPFPCRMMLPFSSSSF